MANITIRDWAYQHDLVETEISGWCILPDAVDCTNAEAVTGIAADALIPSGTEICFAFNTGTSWFSLSEQGYAQAFATTITSASDLQENGNTYSDITALEAIPAFIGQSVKVAVALFAPDDTAIPVLKTFGITQTPKDTKTARTELSQEFTLGSNGLVMACTADTTTTGTGSINLEARLRQKDGTLGQWLSLSSLALVECAAIQFKAEMSVDSPNSGVVKLNAITCTYINQNQGSVDATEKNLITNTENWYIDIRQCRLMVRHDPLDSNSGIKAYIALRDLPGSVEGYTLGTGTGEKAQYDLPQKSGIDATTLKLYVDGARVYTNYELNTITGKLTYTAAKGSILTCSYEYGLVPEEWQEMTQTASWEMPKYDQTEYSFALPEDSDAKAVCALKLVLTVKNGSSTKEAIGKGTGYKATYKLANRCTGTMTVYANNSALATSKYSVLEGGTMVQANAASGAALTASYSWQSPAPVISQLIAVFSE